MKKTASFASQDIKGWPRPEDIEHYFLAPPEKRWFFDTGVDGARFDAEGIEGTEHLPRGRDRKNIALVLCAHPTLGVYVQWSKWDGKRQHVYHAKGDLSRLLQFVRNMHDTPLSVGLLVPFEIAWKAVKEFLETDGQLPKSIEWVDSCDLPEDVFPEPHDPIVEERLLRE